eukprot:g77425.t1
MRTVAIPASPNSGYRNKKRLMCHDVLKYQESNLKLELTHESIPLYHGKTVQLSACKIEIKADELCGGLTLVCHLPRLPVLWPAGALR